MAASAEILRTTIQHANNYREFSYFHLQVSNELIQFRLRHNPVQITAFQKYILPNNSFFVIPFKLCHKWILAIYGLRHIRTVPRWLLIHRHSNFVIDNHQSFLNFQFKCSELSLLKVETLKRANTEHSPQKKPHRKIM